MRRMLAMLVLLPLLLTGCAQTAETRTENDFVLYYAALPDVNDGGDAIQSCLHRVSDSAGLDTAELAEVLIAALLQTPKDPGLRSPFPAGTSLQKLSVAGGRATVDFSDQYAKLSGIDLSIADACLTLTLTQLKGVYAVRITANGRELPYRKTQLLTAADTLLSSGEDVLRPINVSLYFLDTQTGGLRAQAQTLALYEGQTRVSAVVEALKSGSAGDETLHTLLPGDFSVQSGRTEGGVCYVNLSGRTPLPEDEALRALAVESLARSLLSLDGVDEVQFLVDGGSVPEWTVSAEGGRES